MNGRGNRKKKGIAVQGVWLPVGLDFLRSRACAELSPHGAKLLLDVLSMLGPNAAGNGNISLTPRVMAVRGWSGRETLGAAVRELIDHGLLIVTRQGSRLDCTLFATTLYALDCDHGKIDVRPGCYRTTDYMGPSGEFADVPTEEKPARWRHARKGVSTGAPKGKKTELLTPPRDDAPPKRPATGRSDAKNEPDSSTLSRHGTKPPIFEGAIVPPRVTFIDKPSVRCFYGGLQ